VDVLFETLHPISARARVVIINFIIINIYDLKAKCKNKK
jgi:hypothetical protein